MFGEGKTKSFQVFYGLIVTILTLSCFAWIHHSDVARQARFSLSRLLMRTNTSLATFDYARMDTEHFSIKYNEANLSNASLVAEAAEGIYGSVIEFFGVEPPIRTLLVLYPDSETLAKSFGWDKDERAMGVYYGGTIRLLNPDEWITEGDKRIRFIKEGPMAHEFAHLLVDFVTSGNYPRWYTEGVAQYVEKQITGFEFSPPLQYNLQSVGVYDFATLEKNFDQLDQRVAYWECLQAVELIVDKYGEDRIFLILRLLGQGNDMAQSFFEATGQPLAAFETELLSQI
ncbi:MAG: hypothetical protein GXY50_00520 [Syntrophomonadaceae bacterium]|nr:hypothetical protein [Syntrophomonadaceae bacterium]